jgi:ubiquitin-protein ligase
MDIARIQREFADAQRTFALVALRPTTDGKVYARTALQTTAGQNYVLSIKFPDNYPNEMPRVFIDAPAVTSAPHRYQTGSICYMHPSLWNPGAHNLTFVIARAAKWLNKYDVWRNNGGVWPGAEISHPRGGF